MPFVRCPKRVVVDGKLAAFEGQLLTQEQAKALGVAEPEKKQPKKVSSK